MNIGEKIRKLRKLKNKSQEELAFDLGVSRQTINKWETDKAQPSTDNVISLCTIFEVSADYFLDTETEKEIVDKQTIATNVSTQKVNGKHKALIVCSVIDGILFFISTVWTVVFGLVAFSTNDGDAPVKTDSIDTSEFAIMLALSILLLVVEILLFINIYKTRQNTPILAKNTNYK